MSNASCIRTPGSYVATFPCTELDSQNLKRVTTMKLLTLSLALPLRANNP